MGQALTVADEIPPSEEWRCLRCKAVLPSPGGGRPPVSCVPDAGGCGRSTDWDDPNGYTRFFPSSWSEAKVGLYVDADVREKRALQHSDSRASTGSHSLYADALLRGGHFATFRDTDELYVYEDGVYRPDGESMVRAWVEEHHQEKKQGSPTSHLVNEVLHAVQRRTYTSREAFNAADKLCLQNGVLDLTALTIGEHSPQARFTYRLPVPYDPSATCPRFVRFIEEVLPGELNAIHRLTVQMLFGYCLERGNPYQVAVMAVGNGNNGKSTLLTVLRDLLGPDAVSAETLQRLSENRFSTASLWGRLANVCADIPSSAIRFSGTFKMLTGGDLVTAERKFTNAFSFVNGAKLIFSANGLPTVDDQSFAFWRRWILVPFSEDFTGREDRGLPDALRAELSGILNWSLEGLRILRAARAFPNGSSADGLMEEWKCRSDPLYWFLRENVAPSPSEWIPKDDFYQRYAEFAEEHGLQVLGKEEVGNQLPRHFPQVRTTRKGGEGNQVRVWSGIMFRDLPILPRQASQGSEIVRLDRLDRYPPPKSEQAPGGPE